MAAKHLLPEVRGNAQPCHHHVGGDFQERERFVWGIRLDRASIPSSPHLKHRPERLPDMWDGSWGPRITQTLLPRSH